MRNFAMFAIAAGLLGSSAAVASGLDFKLENATGYDIASVAVGNSDSDEWIDVAMDQEILEDAATVDIAISGDPDSCKWDLKVDWDGEYPATIWQDINLCNISEITLKYDRETDETTAFTK